MNQMNENNPAAYALVIGWQALIQELSEKGALDLQSLQKKLQVSDDSLDECSFDEKEKAVVRSWLHLLMVGPMSDGF